MCVSGPGPAGMALARYPADECQHFFSSPLPPNWKVSLSTTNILLKAMCHKTKLKAIFFCTFISQLEGTVPVLTWIINYTREAVQGGWGSIPTRGNNSNVNPLVTKAIFFVRFQKSLKHSFIWVKTEFHFFNFFLK